MSKQKSCAASPIANLHLNHEEAAHPHRSLLIQWSGRVTAGNTRGWINNETNKFERSERNNSKGRMKRNDRKLRVLSKERDELQENSNNNKCFSLFKAQISNSWVGTIALNLSRSLPSQLAHVSFYTCSICLGFLIAQIKELLSLEWSLMSWLPQSPN